MARGNEVAELINKHVGRRIHDYRIAAGISRENLATSVGVTHQQLAKYEHGTNRISVGRLVLICKILNQPISVFIDGYNEIKKEKIVLDKERITMELVKSFNSIHNEKIKEAINNLARVISK